MKTAILKYLQASTNSLSIEQVVLGFVAAAIIGGMIYLSYRFSHSAAVYSARFNVSLVMLTLVTTLIMSVIGNNVALSLGMVGALSIVRYRTAIKDPRDTAYIFWAIAVGIGCGVSQYLLIGVGSITLFAFMLLTKQTASSGMQLLIVHSELRAQNQIEITINEYLYKSFKVLKLFISNN